MTQQASWADRMAELFVVANSDAAAQVTRKAQLVREIADCQQAEQVATTSALESRAHHDSVAVMASRFGLSRSNWFAKHGENAGGLFLVAATVPSFYFLKEAKVGLAVITLLILGLAIAMFIVSGRAKKTRDGLHGELTVAARQLASADAAASQARARRESLEAEVSSLEITSPLRTIGEVLLPVRAVRVAGRSALVDESGVVPPTKLALPELPASESVLAEVDAAIEAARARPAMLAADSSSGSVGRPGELHGQERQLAEAVRQFREMVEGARVQETTVRLVERNNGLATLARKGSPMASPRGAILRRGGDAKSAAALISSSLGRARSGDAAARDRLQRASASLKDAAAGMGSLRAKSVRHLHEAVANVVVRSDLAHSRLYCPRCNQTPEYLFHRVGLQEDTIHLLEPPELLGRLQGDPDAAARIDREPALVEALAQTIEKLGELRVTLETAEAELEQARSRNVPITELRVREAMLRAHRSELQKILTQLRASVRRIVTGHIRPLTELSRQAVLELDPDTESWTCAACNTTFDDPAVARMGQVLRIRDELMMPMWGHLWTEKADFLRSEVFRSNEQVAGLVEKESVAMRDIAEQYRSDMRPVRENLIRSVSEAMQGRERLTDTLQSLVALGAASRQEVAARVREVGEMTGGDLTAMKQRAERKESFLVQLPLGQVVARPGLRDPVEQQSDPTEVFHRVRVHSAPALVAGLEEAD